MTVLQLIENAHTDRYFFEINRGIFDRSGATAVYDQQFKKTLSQPDSLFVIIGTDSGCLIEYVNQLPPAQGSMYVFIELPEVIDALATQKASLFPLPNNVIVCTQSEWEALLTDTRWVHFVVREKMQCLRAFCAIDCFYPAYTEFTYTVEQIVVQLAWRIKGQIAAHTFVRQQLKNLPYNHTPAACLRDTFKGQRAIVCAGGPSLDQHLDWIKAQRDSLLVVAVSRVAKRLQDVGITPDMVVSVDPNARSFDVSREIFLYEPLPLFVHAYHVYHELAQAWPGQHVYLGPRYMWDLEEDNVAVMGPTVTNAAIHILVAMGCDEICLAGLDLCFSPEGHTHAKGSQEFEAGPALGYLGMQVPTNEGGIAQTDPAFYESIHTIATQAAEAVTVGCQLINLSGQAAKIDHVQYCQRDALDVRAPQFNVRARLNEIVSNATPKVSHDTQAAKASLQGMQADLSSVMRTCQTALSVLRASTVSPQAWDEINTLEADMARKYSHVLTVLKLFGYQYFTPLYEAQLAMDADTQNSETVKRASQAGFQAYIDAGQALQPLLAAALVDVKASAALDSTGLNEGTLPDAPARAWYCLKRFGDHTSVHTALTQRAAAFETRLSESRTRLKHNPYIKSPKRTLTHKLLYLFNHKDVDAIIALINQMQAHPVEDGEHLKLLAYGYVAELNDHPQDAKEAYYAAAQDEGLQELALNHLTSVLMSEKDFHNAAQALDCLACVSPGYLPLAAQAWQALGECDKAQGYQAQFNALTTASKDAIT